MVWRGIWAALPPDHFVDAQPAWGSAALDRVLSVVPSPGKPGGFLSAGAVGRACAVRVRYPSRVTDLLGDPGEFLGCLFLGCFPTSRMNMSLRHSSSLV